MKTVCSYINCSNSRHRNKGMKFYCFPKDKKLLPRWILNSGNKGLLSVKAEELLLYVLCEEHFYRQSFKNPIDKRLIQGAIPKHHEVSSENPSGFETVNVDKMDEGMEESEESCDEVSSLTVDRDSIKKTYSRPRSKPSESLPLNIQVVANAHTMIPKKKVVLKKRVLLKKYRKLKEEVSSLKAKIYHLNENSNYFLTF